VAFPADTTPVYATRPRNRETAHPKTTENIENIENHELPTNNSNNADHSQKTQSSTSRTTNTQHRPRNPKQTAPAKRRKERLQQNQKPRQVHPFPRCHTVWHRVAKTTSNQNEDTRSKYTTTQRHPKPSNQGNDPDQQLSSKNQARNPIRNTSTTKPRKTSLSIDTEDKQT
jgi:hypothetical protein